MLQPGLRSVHNFFFLILVEKCNVTRIARCHVYTRLSRAEGDALLSQICVGLMRKFGKCSRRETFLVDSLTFL